MPGNIDSPAQAQRKKEALHSAVAATLLRLLAAAVLAWLGLDKGEGGLLGSVLLVLAGVNLVMIVPTWKSYQIRMKEIEGGEEDAAAQY